MIKCSVFIAISLDGYIARLDDDISWLTNPAYSAEPEDYGFAEFYASVDTLVMGRKTYEIALLFPEWPYGGKQVVVLSRTSPAVPTNLADTVEVMSGSPFEVIQQLETSGIQHVYVDGGQTIQGFLKAGLIHELTITTIPVLLGSGIPLFGSVDHDIHLSLMTTRGYPNGFVQTKYRVNPSN